MLTCVSLVVMVLRTVAANAREGELVQLYEKAPAVFGGLSAVKPMVNVLSVFTVTCWESAPVGMAPVLLSNNDNAGPVDKSVVETVTVLQREEGD